jgi:hypothetical protein
MHFQVCSAVRAEEVRRAGGEEEERRRWAALLLGRKRREERWVGLEKEKVREREEGLSFLFQNIVKTFKTIHKQTIKPCIQIMMHKHLLLLNY